MGDEETYHEECLEIINKLAMCYFEMPQYKEKAEHYLGLSLKLMKANM